MADFDHVGAIDSRQPQVGDDDVIGKFCELFERTLAGLGLIDQKTLLGEALRDRHAERLLVLND